MKESKHTLSVNPFSITAKVSLASQSFSNISDPLAGQLPARTLWQTVINGKGLEKSCGLFTVEVTWLATVIQLSRDRPCSRPSPMALYRKDTAHQLTWTAFRDQGLWGEGTGGETCRLWLNGQWGSCTLPPTPSA